MLRMCKGSRETEIADIPRPITAVRWFRLQRINSCKSNARQLMSRRDSSINATLSSCRDERTSLSSHLSSSATLNADGSSRTSSANVRRFAANVGIHGAARDVRNAVQKALGSNTNKRKTLIARPLKYETFIHEKQAQFEQDPEVHLLIFPHDDFVEISEPIPQTTTVPMIFNWQLASPRWLFTRDALKVLAGPHKLVRFNYTTYNGRLSQEFWERILNIEPITFESDFEVPQKSASYVETTDRVLVEGWLSVVKPEALEKGKGEKLYCTIKRIASSGDVMFESSKGVNRAASKPGIVIKNIKITRNNSNKAYLKLDVSNDENVSPEPKPIYACATNGEEADSIQRWLDAVVENDAKATNEQFLSAKLSVASDSISVRSSDTNSLSGKEEDTWKGRQSAASALRPPTILRQNVFSLLPQDCKAKFAQNGNLKPSLAHSVSMISQSSGLFDIRHSPTKQLLSSYYTTYLINLRQLNLNVKISQDKSGQIEPFFITVFVFDSSTGRRITEEFNMCITTPETSTLLPRNDPKQSMPTDVNGVVREQLISFDTRQTFFSIDFSARALWVVMRIDRQLTPDIQGDAYFKPNDLNVAFKARKTASTAALRGHSYRTRFAWTARPLVPEDSRKDIEIKSPLFRCESNKLTDSDVQRCLSDYTKFLRTSRSIVPDAFAIIRVDSNVNINQISTKVNPMYYQLLPKQTSEKEPPVFELQTFDEGPSAPWDRFVHLLYVYPQMLKFDAQKVFTKARNIACKVQLITGDNIRAESVFSRLDPHGPFVREASTCVQHHEQNPRFSEEIKIQLPLSLEAHDHLLFKFVHVSVAGAVNPKKASDTFETPIGYAWLPLLSNTDLLTFEKDEQDFELMVAADLPEKYYQTKSLGFAKGESISSIKWVDSKPLFQVKIRLVSSIFTTDPNIQKLFKACQKLQDLGVPGDAAELIRSTDPPRSCSPLAHPPDTEDFVNRKLTTIIQNLDNVHVERFLPFLPVLLRRIFHLLTVTMSEQLVISILITTISLCQRLSTKKSRVFLRHFLRFYLDEELNEDKPTIHEVIMKHFPALIQKAKEVNRLNTLFTQSWFLLEAASKSMAFVKIALTAKREQFSPELISFMHQFEEWFIPAIIQNQENMPTETRMANKALSNFIARCLSLLDRGQMFSWIDNAIRHYDSSDVQAIREYKLDLLNVLCEHEHFLPLSLPLLLDKNSEIVQLHFSPGSSLENATAGSSSSGFLSRIFTQLFPAPTNSDSNETDKYHQCFDEFYLSESFCYHHYPVGILLQELNESMREPRGYRRRVILLVRNLIAKQSFDTRNSEASSLQRIAMLYLPLIRFALDHIEDIEKGSDNYEIDPQLGPKGTFRSEKWKSLERSSTLFGDFTVPTKPRDVTPEFAPITEKLDAEEVINILITVVWVLHHVPIRLLALILNHADDHYILKFIRLLEVTLNVFRHHPGESQAEVSTPKAEKRLSIVETDCEEPLSYEYLQSSQLTQETAMIVLNVLEVLSREQAKTGLLKVSPASEELFRSLLAMHLCLIDTNWPDAVRLHALAALGVFINLFRLRLFESGPLDALLLLMEKLLLQMASRFTTMQTAAAALFQIVLRAGYEAAAHARANQALYNAVMPSTHIYGNPTREVTAVDRLGRPGSQAGVALARLLGAQKGLSHCLDRFERGLAILESMVPRDTKKHGAFENAVSELIRQLRGVLNATSALAPAAKDKIKLADLHIKLADSYRGSAAYRALWFENLAKLYANDGWHCEAAVSLGHSVAIIAKELQSKRVLQNPDWTVLNWISESIGEEEHVGDNINYEVQPGDFSMDQFASRLEQCARELTLAERHEAVSPLYRLLIPPLENNYNFNSLRQLFTELHQSSSRALEASTSGKRRLSTYFKVIFIGKCFGDQNESEWIYRANGHTSLAEFSTNMELDCKTIQYDQNIKIVAEFEPDAVQKHPSTAFIQVTHVDPLVEDETKRWTFQAHTNIDKFVVESPVIEGDKWTIREEPPVNRQALKRTFISTLGKFPCNRRRLLIDKTYRKTEILDPLQFAVLKLNKKAQEIISVLDESTPVDIKRLQLLVQGAIMPTVNAGPLVYAETFTQPEQIERYGHDKIKELQLAFRKLLKSCERGLVVNASCIGDDQAQYQECLVNSAQGTLERLITCFGPEFRELYDERQVESSRPAVHLLETISGFQR